MVVEDLTRTEFDDGVKRLYFYRLIKNKINITFNKDVISLQSYGIEVERQDILDNKLTDICRNCVKDISPDRHKVHNLIRLLYDKRVSPIHLVDVIGGYVDKYIGDFDIQIKSMAY